MSVRDSHPGCVLPAAMVIKCVWTTSCTWRRTSSSRAQGDALTFQAEDRLGCLCRSTVSSSSGSSGSSSSDTSESDSDSDDDGPTAQLNTGAAGNDSPHDTAHTDTDKDAETERRDVSDVSYGIIPVCFVCRHTLPPTAPSAAPQPPHCMARNGVLRKPPN